MISPNLIYVRSPVVLTTSGLPCTLPRVYVLNGSCEYKEHIDDLTQPYRYISPLYAMQDDHLFK